MASYRHASLLLTLINVAQPIPRDELLAGMGDVDEVEVHAALKFLISRGLVKQLPGDTYRTTWDGQEAQFSRVLRTARDVHRMWHLSHLSDELRRNGKGEVS